MPGVGLYKINHYGCEVGSLVFPMWNGRWTKPTQRQLFTTGQCAILVRTNIIILVAREQYNIKTTLALWVFPISMTFWANVTNKSDVISRSRY